MSASRLKKEQRGEWLTVDAGTVRMIRHADALAVWVLLLNCPDDWLVRRRWLQSELGIGSIRLRGAVAHLEALGLWERRAIRDEESGRLGGTEIVIREVPVVPPSVAIPRASRNLDARGIASVGKPSHYQETNALPIDKNNNNGCCGDAARPRKIDGQPDTMNEEVQVAVATIIATLSEQQQSDVLAVLSARLTSGSGGPISSIPGYVAGLARRSAAGTLTLPSSIKESRQSDKIESQKSEILAAFGDGDAIFLDGQPAEIELDKFARTAACTVPLAAAIAADRITIQKELQNEN